jgi:Rieske Fe-S protein
VQGPIAYATSVIDGTLVVDLAQRPDCNRSPGGHNVVNGVLTLALSEVPALASVGGSQVLTVGGFPDPLALVRLDASTIVAVDGKCTHLCCTVGWDAARNQWSCPCHGSTFAPDGTLTHGPARFDLPRFPVSFDGQTIVITMITAETKNDCV